MKFTALTVVSTLTAACLIALCYFSGGLTCGIAAFVASMISYARGVIVGWDLNDGSVQPPPEA